MHTNCHFDGSCVADLILLSQTPETPFLLGRHPTRPHLLEKCRRVGCVHKGFRTVPY